MDVGVRAVVRRGRILLEVDGRPPCVVGRFETCPRCGFRLFVGA